MKKRFVNHFMGFACVALVCAFASTLVHATPAQQDSTQVSRVYEGKSLFGDSMYAVGKNPVNAGASSNLERAFKAAKSNYEKNPTLDNTVWYGRLLGYKSLMREAVEVFTAGLKRYPNSARLYRHRAHRYFSLREFGKSIKDGLMGVKLYGNQPLEREPLGPDYFPSTPDVVQFYLYYHLGQAYFAEHKFDEAAKWFSKSREVGEGVDDPESVTAAVYWEYLSLARGQNYDKAKTLLDGYTLNLVDLKHSTEAHYYFSGIQLFKGNLDPKYFFADRQNRSTGKPFSTVDGIRASSAYSLANYYLLHGWRTKAKKYLGIACDVKTWAYFARIQAEADWVFLYGKNDKP